MSTTTADLLAWADDDAPADLPTIAKLSAGQPTKAHSKPSRHGQIIIFTSGTTGLPKGARREEPADLKPLITFFGAIPYRGNSTVVLAAPLFHSWGLINFGFGLSTAPTYVLRRRFDAAQVIRDIEERKAEVLVVVPLMMQRMVDADPEVIKKADVSSLKITASSGSALAGDLANQFMDTFTDSVYNFYGATETGWVTIASPKDLREAPGTAGVPPHRTTVKILDTDGKEVPRGETGVDPRRQRHAVRRLHRRQHQDVRRRPDEHRRPRPFRRERPTVRVRAAMTTWSSPAVRTSSRASSRTR